LQNYIAGKLDEEFKLFLRWRGISLDSGLFELEFNPPQNFAAYRQSELDTARVTTFASMEAFPYISKRFAMERFLGLSEEEIDKNEKLWREENGKEPLEEPKGSDLRSVGVSSSDIQSDQQTGEEMNAEPEAGAESPEVTAPVASEPAGGAAAAPAAPVTPATPA
jgi:hypothetical protein